MKTQYKFYDKTNLGIDRSDMPQISKDNLDDFLLHFADKVKVSKLKMRLCLIKPTQNAINEDKMLDMIAKERDWKSRIFIISSDNYLLDGHHDYALGLEEDEECEVTVYRVNLKIKDLLKRTKQLKISTKVDINDDIVKDLQVGELLQSGCRIVTDIHLEQHLQDVYEEFGFEKAIPTHLVKKIIVNKSGHKQTVWIDPTKSNGTKYDFNKHPYKGVESTFISKVENAVIDVLNKKGIKFDIHSVFAKYGEHDKIQVSVDGEGNQAIEWYKTKNFDKTGIIGIKHGGKIHEKKIQGHASELEHEKKYLESIDEKRKAGEKAIEKITEKTSPTSGLKEFGGFKVGDYVKFKDGDEDRVGKIKSIKHHEKYDKFGTAIIEDYAGMTYSRSLKKVQKDGEITDEQFDSLFEEDSKSLSEAMMGNQNAKKDGNVEEYKKVKSLGGTNNAVLVVDKEGKQWVTKDLNSGRALIEYQANKIYKSFGLSVPEVKIESDGKLYAEYIPNTVTIGEYLKSASIVDKGKIYKQVKDGFVADALLANWDVVGLSEDNLVVDPVNKKVYRIDNGGSLTYRAQGGEKGDDFSDKVIELETLKDSKKNAQSAKFFKGVTDADIAAQIKNILDNKDEYMSVANDFLDKNSQFKETGVKMVKRLSHLETLYNSEIKQSAKAEGYFKNGLYAKTGIPEIDKIREKADEALAWTEDDQIYFDEHLSGDSKAAKSLYDDIMNLNDSSKKKIWYKKALQAGCDSVEIYHIREFTSGDYSSFNNALVKVTNAATGNINPSKLVLKDEDLIEAMNGQVSFGQAHPMDTYWPAILGAAKTINHHHEDKQYNKDKIHDLKLVNQKIKNVIDDAEKNKANYSKADLNMLNVYLDMSNMLIKAHASKSKAEQVWQYTFSHADVKTFNAKYNPKKKEKTQKTKEITFNQLNSQGSKSFSSWLVRAKLLTSGLAKLEKSGLMKYEQPIYRKLKIHGQDADENNANLFSQLHHEGGYVLWQRNNSCSKSESVWDGNYKFNIVKHNGIDVEDISHHSSSEKEVMLKPFSCIKINKVISSTGSNKIFEVEQVA